MRRVLQFAASLLVVGVIAGCPAQEAPREKSEPEPTAPSEEQVSESPEPKADEPKLDVEEVQKQLSEAGEAIGNFSEQQSEEALEAARGSYEEAKAKLADLREDVDQLEGTAKSRYEEAIAALEKNLAATKEGLDQLQDASGAAWAEARDDLQRAFEDLEKAYQDAASAWGQSDTPKEKAQ